jgi:CHAT domain-containing protein/tetratricopeptide (TPR) repeat protein
MSRKFKGWLKFFTLCLVTSGLSIVSTAAIAAQVHLFASIAHNLRLELRLQLQHQQHHAALLHSVIQTTASLMAASQTAPSQTHGQRLEWAGQERFDAQQYNEAVTLLRQAIQAYQMENDGLRQAIAWGNLALVYQQLGEWQQAEQAIQNSLQLLSSSQMTESSQRSLILAQVLETQGRLQLAQGQAEQALTTWSQSVQLYEYQQDSAGVIRSQLYRTQSLQALGHYRRAIDLLTKVSRQLNRQPDNVLKAVQLQQLGDALRVAGDLTRSTQVLEQSVTIARALPDVNLTASIYLSLGNTIRIDQTESAQSNALTQYQQAETLATNLQTQVLARLNQLSLWLDRQNWSQATTIVAKIQTDFEQIGVDRLLPKTRLNFAYSLIRLKQAIPELSVSWREIAQQLATIHRQTVEVGDRRSASYALGILGYLYEQNQDWRSAATVTSEALQMAQALNSADIDYRWQWQLGRILRAQNNEAGAIAAYEAAINTLQSLRRDVVTSNLNFQFVFRQAVEDPLHRELVDLLLQLENPQQEHLQKARQIISSLQVLQLENFLQEPCANAEPKLLDKVVDQPETATAIFYPIVLHDRLEVIYKLPQEKELRHYRSPVTAEVLQKTVKQLQLDLEEEYTFASVKTGAQSLYDWILRSAQADLQANGIKTLVFALDSGLRSIPMSILHDGQQYLIQHYAIALAPDLSLLNPQRLTTEQLKVLAVGLTDPPQNQNFPTNFAQLKNVNQELAEIAAADIPITTIRNQAFTLDRFNRILNLDRFSIVHLATHGQFSSNPQEAFLLTSNGAIGINDLDRLFRTRSQLRSDSVELLILSACETAIGDNLATLGIAGAAFRAGARSAIASLWTLDDSFSVEFTHQFYQSLKQPNTTKAIALQQAQKALLANPQYEHPRYWSTYILIGNWL